MENLIIIAEIGVNHNGNLEMAKELIYHAYLSGADYVKFQSYKAEALVSKSTKKAPYQKVNNDGQNQFGMLKKFEFTIDDFIELNNYCNNLGIKFLTTPFDENTFKLVIEKLKLDIIKISSADLNNYSLLKVGCDLNIPMIISTGMATLEDVKASVEFIKNNNGIIHSILQCTTSYPCNPSDANISVISTFIKTFNHLIGFSDHTIGDVAAISAITLGAKIIEKHITIDKKLPGPDHKSSMEVKELPNFIEKLRSVNDYLGNSEKKPTKTENINKKYAIKKIISAKDIEMGETLGINDLKFLRNDVGIEVKYLFDFIGKKANKYIKIDTPINWSDFE